MAVLGLVWMPGTALGDYEQVPEHFGVEGEAEQLREALGAAVNESGAGGVEAGSLYVVGPNARVVRYAPGEEGEEPAFREAWGWGVLEGGPEEYDRCGPAVAAEKGEAAPCKPSKAVAPFGGEEVGHFETLAGVAVDQSTGYVYVLNVHSSHREHHLIEAFTAKGSPVGAGFGDAGRRSPAPPEAIAESPESHERLHEMFPSEGALAVDGEGTVYLPDTDYSGAESPKTRVMCFRPQSPGDYEHYVYCGEGHDIAAAAAQRFSKVALAPGGRIVAGNRELIREYGPGAGAGSSPVCSRPVSGQLQGMTANPATGEVLYFTFGDRSLHRLGPCDEATGKFTELQAALKPAPESGGVYALAVNAGRSWGPSRPAGVLYAVDAEKHGEQLGIGDVLAPAGILSPEVLSEAASATGTTSSTLRAEIDPRGFATSYRFEYLPAATYAAQKAAAEGEGKSGEEAEDAAFAGAAQAPPLPGVLGGGSVGSAAAAIGGLAPDTAYRFRAIASSACEGPGEPACVTKGEAASFATYPPAGRGPPDGRAYELVSPAEKHGGEVFPADPRVSSCGECKPPGYSAILVVYPMQSAPGGDAVAYMGYPFSPQAGAAVFNSYVSRRGEAGWQTTAVSPPLLASNSGEDLAFDPGLEEGMIGQGTPQLPASPPAPPGYANLYLQGAADPAALTPLLTSPPPNRAPGSLTLEYAGAAPGYSCQLFAANDALTGATPYAPAPPDPGSVGRNLYEWCGGALKLVNVMPGNAAVAAGAAFASASPDTDAVSADGRRVYWHVGSTLYVREDGQVTREIKHAGSFLTASPDGSKALLSDGCLYSLLTEACTDLTQGEEGFQGIAGAGEGLSRIYFLDTAALPGSGENERGEEAQAGKDNLYLYQEGAPTRFIATLAATDGNGSSGLDDWASSPTRRTAEASPDGRYLAFGSTLALTGYGNVGPCGREYNKATEKYETVDAPCAEAFLYDSATGRLTCPSCNPSGEAPLGPSTLRRIYDERAWQPQPRYLTDSGRLYFDSQDRLSPLDANGRVEDVYEAEPQGVGSCQRQAGCISLISPGTGSVDSNLLAVDQSGANVFFTTREALVPADKDELIDLYDARVDGGFPGESETQRAECLGEACQPAPSAPGEVTPASAAFSGTGNLLEAAPRPAPRHCARGKVRRRGRCVAKHGKHHRHRKRGRAKRRHGGARR
jgi:hypothetical protein